LTFRSVAGVMVFIDGQNFEGCRDGFDYRSDLDTTMVAQFLRRLESES
jgi:hypothetical protein